MVSHSLLCLVVYVGVLCLSRLVAIYREAGVASDPNRTPASKIAGAIVHGGFLIALGIALHTMFSHPGGAGSIDESLLENALWALSIFSLLLISLTVNDIFILPTVNNLQAVKDGNLAVALVEAASLIGTSFIMTGTMQGDGPVAATLVFFIVGQVGMLGSVWFYELITRKVYVVREVGDGNVAAGVLLAGKILAIALIITKAVTGDFTDWGKDLVATAEYFAVGLAALVAVEKFVEWSFLSSGRVEELIERREVAPAVLVACLSVATALVITAVNPL